MSDNRTTAIANLKAVLDPRNGRTDNGCILVHERTIQMALAALSHQEPDAPQGGECGEVPQSLLQKWYDEWEFEAAATDSAPALEKHIAMRAIAWGRQNRAASAGKPKTTMADLLALRGAAEVEDRRHYSRMEYPSPHPPADAVSSVQGEGMVAIDEQTRSALMEAIDHFKESAEEWDVSNSPEAERGAAQDRWNAEPLSRLASK